MASNRPHKGLYRLVKATGYSLAGLKAAWHNEEAFRLDTLLFVILGPSAWWFGESSAERALLLGSLVLLIVVELLNSGLEAIVDRIGPEHHELSGRAKDMGSAAVFIALLNVALVWIMLLFDI